MQNAYGKGPENILQTALRKKKQADYECVIAVLDTDIPWTAKLTKEAKANQITLIGNTPCIEALFLSLLEQKAPLNTQKCKTAIANTLSADLLDKNSYESWCSEEKIEQLRMHNKDLDNLLKAYEGHF